MCCLKHLNFWAAAYCVLTCDVISQRSKKISKLKWSESKVEIASNFVDTTKCNLQKWYKNLGVTKTCITYKIAQKYLIYNKTSVTSVKKLCSLAKKDIFGWLPGIGTKINKTFFLWRGLCWVSRGRDFAQIDHVLAHDPEFWYSNPNCEIIARVFIDLEFFRILTRQLLFWFYLRLREW